MIIKRIVMAMILLLGLVHSVNAGIERAAREVTVFYAGMAQELSSLRGGIFSNAITSALLGEADTNKDGILSQNEFSIYVRVDTKNKSKRKQVVRVVNPWLDAEAPICGKVTYVLAIGINYTHTKNPLQYAVSDARNIASSLQKQCKDVNIISYTDNLATKNGIIDAINNIKSQVHYDDNIIVSFSGYGVEINGKNYIIPNNASVANLANMEREAIRVSELIEILTASRTKHALLLIDTNFRTIKNNKTR